MTKLTRISGQQARTYLIVLMVYFSLCVAQSAHAEYKARIDEIKQLYLKLGLTSDSLAAKRLENYKDRRVLAFEKLERLAASGKEGDGSKWASTARAMDQLSISTFSLSSDDVKDRSVEDSSEILKTMSELKREEARFWTAIASPRIVSESVELNKIIEANEKQRKELQKAWNLIESIDNEADDEVDSAIVKVMEIEQEYEALVAQLEDILHDQKETIIEFEEISEKLKKLVKGNSDIVEGAAIIVGTWLENDIITGPSEFVALLSDKELREGVSTQVTVALKDLYVAGMRDQNITRVVIDTRDKTRRFIEEFGGFKVAETVLYRALKLHLRWAGTGASTIGLKSDFANFHALITSAILALFNTATEAHRKFLEDPDIKNIFSDAIGDSVIDDLLEIEKWERVKTKISWGPDLDSRMKRAVGQIRAQTNHFESIAVREEEIYKVSLLNDMKQFAYEIEKLNRNQGLEMESFIDSIIEIQERLKSILKSS